jgi:hypothetical protein
LIVIGSLAYEKVHSLAVPLRLLVSDPPVLSMRPWVEIFNPLQQLIRILGKFTFVLIAALTGLETILASAAFSLAPDPSL